MMTEVVVCDGASVLGVWKSDGQAKSRQKHPVDPWIPLTHPVSLVVVSMVRHRSWNPLGEGWANIVGHEATANG